MKNFTKLLSFLALLFLFVAFIGCKNASASDNNEEEEYFYYDEELGKFTGMIAYSTKNYSMQTLITTCLDEIYWEIKDYNGNTIWQEYVTNGVNGWIKIYTGSNYAGVGAGIVTQATPELIKWCDVPGVQVKIVFTFITGQAYNMASKRVYHGYKGSLLPDITSYYGYTDQSYPDSEFLLVPVVNNVKIKSAKAYTKCGYSGTASINWENYANAYSCVTQPIGFSFVPTLYEKPYRDEGNDLTDEIIKLELETLDGRKFVRELETLNE